MCPDEQIAEDVLIDFSSRQTTKTRLDDAKMRASFGVLRYTMNVLSFHYENTPI